MKSLRDLEVILSRIDGKGYKAYKDIQGQYRFDRFILSIDYVQGDPFASPSRIRVSVSGKDAEFPLEFFDTPYKRKAVVDFLSRTIAGNIYQLYERVGGSGKSGLLSTGHCGQEILERNYIMIDESHVEARLEVGLPAAGRRVLGKKAREIFFDALPKIVASSLFYSAIAKKKLIKQIELAEDQCFLRQEIKRKKLVAFIANGSILPRESGISQKPMEKEAVPFQSPDEYEIELTLPHFGPIRGMGIPEGITLIVGGGFHGKSTLLQALELGVYDHIAGDGREYLVTCDNAVKIKAENGRNVEKVDISPFINDLPGGKNTFRFTTENASGSTSQAANIMEALEIGTDLLLIDEDSSATNFMIRDGRMQQLVQKDKEPITPFIDRVKALYREKGVSTILVIGGSGDYFEVADQVIMMDEYIPRDVTQRAAEIVENTQNIRKTESVLTHNVSRPRVLSTTTFNTRERVKIKPRGLDQISYNKMEINLRELDQLIDVNQTNALCFMLQYITQHLVDGKKTLPEIVNKLYQDISMKGLDVISPYNGHPGNMALPRKHELAGTLNRFRKLKIL